MEQKKAETFADILRDVAEGDETVFEVVKRTLGEGKDAVAQQQVLIGRRKMQAEPPVREDSPPRAHVFHDVAGFTGYLTKFGGDNTVVLVDAIGRKAEAVLDETAKKGFEIVTFEPPLHPAFKPWADVFGKLMPIRQAVDFLRQQRHVIRDPAPRELMAVLSQVRLSKSVIVDASGQSAGVNAVTVETKFQGTAKQVPVELPEVISLTLSLLVDTAERPINIDLVVDGGPGNAPVVILTSADVEQAMIDLFDGFEADIRKELDGKTIGLGRANHSCWTFYDSE
jgi:hypothetical protein